MRVFVSGVERDIAKNSIRINNILGGRSTASFRILDKDLKAEHRMGEEVVIKDNAGRRMFGGVLFRVSALTHIWPGASKPGRGFNVECVGYEYYAGKRSVAKVFRYETITNIVNDIFSNYLEPEGITLGIVDDIDQIMDRAVFGYIPADRVLSSLADASGCWWDIDMEKRFHFRKYGEANRSDFELNDMTHKKNSLSVRLASDHYRNTQIITGGTAATSIQNEQYYMDSEEAPTITLRFRLGDKPPRVYTREGQESLVERTVDLKGGVSDALFFWEPGSDVISYNRNKYTPFKGWVVVSYEGVYPFILRREASKEIGERQGIEGGTGIFENAVYDNTISTIRDAENKALSLLERFSKLGKQVTFTVEGMEPPFPGDVIVANMPEFGLDKEELIVESVVSAEAHGVESHTVKAVAGPSNVSWTRFFAGIIEGMKRFEVVENILEGDQVIIEDEVVKYWEEQERPNIFGVLYPGENTFPGPNTRPMFTFERVNSWMELVNEGFVVARIPPTSRQEVADGIIDTTHTIDSPELPMPVTHIRWYSGIGATSEPETGIATHTVEWRRIVNPGETINVRRRDIRWE